MYVDYPDTFGICWEATSIVALLLLRQPIPVVLCRCICQKPFDLSLHMRGSDSIMPSISQYVLNDRSTPKNVPKILKTASILFLISNLMLQSSASIIFLSVIDVARGSGRVCRGQLIHANKSSCLQKKVRVVESCKKMAKW